MSQSNFYTLLPVRVFGHGPLDKIHAGCAYNDSHLKQIVRKKCDMLMEFRFVDEKVQSSFVKYNSRNHQPARFEKF